MKTLLSVVGAMCLCTSGFAASASEPEPMLFGVPVSAIDQAAKIENFEMGGFIIKKWPTREEKVFGVSTWIVGEVIDRDDHEHRQMMTEAVAARSGEMPVAASASNR